jgi:hypothetical protein
MCLLYVGFIIKLKNVIQCNTLLDIYQVLFSAFAIIGSDSSIVANVFESESLSNRPRITVKALMDISASSVGIALPKRLHSNMKHLSLYMEQMKETTKVLMNILNEKMKQNIEILCSMKGIGENTAMNFLIGMGGTAEIYENYKKLIAVSGLGVHY